MLKQPLTSNEKDQLSSYFFREVLDKKDYDDLNNTDTKVHTALNELERYLYIKAQFLYLDFAPPQIIHKIWTIFILHTELYCNYCIRNYNKYIHHKPNESILPSISWFYDDYDLNNIKRNPLIYSVHLSEDEQNHYKLYHAMLKKSKTIFGEFNEDANVIWFNDIVDI